MPVESVGNKSLSKKAQAPAVRRADVQAAGASTSSQVAILQTGTACEDRDAEAEATHLREFGPATIEQEYR